MAADTRDSKSTKESSGSSATVSPAEKSFETFNYPATPENRNSLAGANPNLLAGKHTEPGIVDALKTIKLEDFKEVHKKPCTREGFLTGIGAAFATGGVRAIFGGLYPWPRHFPPSMLTEPAPIFTACSWAVGAFAFGSFAMHEYCQRKRKREKEGMQRVTAALLEKQKIKEEKKREETRKARRNAKEEVNR
ncbi:MAG: hypothetical protein Q9182_004155 [Xanthomendoza sp. 2 TL-2023]